ncbi:MAG: MFS transporter [Verrucomicrobiota bacterium]
MSASHTRNAFFYSVIVTLGGFVFGLDLGVIAGTFSYISKQFGLDDLQIGTVGAAPGLGAVFALLFAGPICNKMGRKKSIQLIALLYLVSAICSALAPNYWTLVAARFLGGLAFCSLSLAAMYLGEITPSHLRGRMVAMNQINIVIGITVAYLVNYLIQQGAESGAGYAETLGLETTAWRWMLGSEIIPALAWLLLLFRIPESPRWLMTQGREEEARKAMAKVLPMEQIDGEVEAINKSIAGSHGAKTGFQQLKELFSRHARKALIIGVTFAIIQPITGINAIQTYAPMVFEQAGSADPLWNTIWLGVAGLFANILAFILVDRLGRRPVVNFGLIWCAVSLGLCGWAFHKAEYDFDKDAIAKISEEISPEAAASIEELGDKDFGSDLEFMKSMRTALGDETADANKNFLIGQAAQLNTGLVLFAIVSFIAAFNLSIGPVMWVIFSEIFPTQLRSIAIPAAHLVVAVVNYFVQWFFPWQLTNMGARDIFLFYCVWAVLGLIALFILLPETKGKSIEEIEAELNKGGKPS